MTRNPIPHLRVVVAVSGAAIAGFAAISAYVLGYSADDLTKGAIVGTWQNVALLAFGFWLGSSSGGKTQTDPKDPQAVEVKNTTAHPVPTHDLPEPEYAQMEEPKP